MVSCILSTQGCSGWLSVYVRCIRVAREAREGEYEWVQEYQFKVKNDEEQRTYLLRFDEEHCTYVDLNTKLQLKKRTRMVQGEDARQDFNRPSKVSIWL